MYRGRVNTRDLTIFYTPLQKSLERAEMDLAYLIHQTSNVIDYGMDKFKNETTYNIFLDHLISHEYLEGLFQLIVQNPELDQPRTLSVKEEEKQ